MGERKFRPRQRAGFTLVEIVVVVAVVAIVAALAIPSLRDMLLSMEMARLDSAAKQIYLVGQNRLVSMRESGTLLQLSNTGGFGSVSLTESGMAVEYSVASNDDTNMATAMKELLPGGAIDGRLAQQHYLIVFLKGNQGLMREVYFSENAFSGWNATSLEEWRSDPAARRSARIGFYDGGGVAVGAVQRLDTPTVDVANGETLELHVTLPVSVTDPDTVKVKIRVIDMSVVDNAREVEWTLKCAAGADGFDRTETAGGNLVYVKVLDQLFASGKNFASVCPGITLGADIGIDVSLEPVRTPVGGVSYLPSSSAYQNTNSLFGGLGTEMRTISGMEYTNLQFQIGSGRHLQNLNLLTPSGGTGSAAVVGNMDLLDNGREDGSIAKYFSAVQTGNIEWGANYPGKSFIPINNVYNTAYGLAFYDGNSYEIRNFRLESFFSSTECIGWGLFGYLNSSQVPERGRGEIRGVRLTDPFIDVKGHQNLSLGALGGALMRTNVTDCHVYVTDVRNANSLNYRVSSQQSCSIIGGLVGIIADARITYSSVSIPLVAGDASLGIGGLAGFVQNAYSIIDGCYANVVELKNESSSGGTGLGMLVGETEAYVANCYGIGTISGAAQYIGGLVGGDGGSRARNRYVVDSYAIVSYSDAVSSNPIQAVTHSDTDQVQNACYVIWPEGANISGLAAGRGVACTLDNLKDRFTALPMWKTGGVSANPYNIMMGNTYPYPSPKGLAGQGTIHYGDWPVRSMGGGG